MGGSLSVRAFAGKNSPEFIKHYNAVKFCSENKLSYPKETIQFFKGKAGGENIEDIDSASALEYLRDGISIDLKMKSEEEYKVVINVADIPKEAETIIVEIIY